MGPPIAEPEALHPPEPPAVADEPTRRYRIEFRPRADLLRKGIDPLGFLDELRELGEAAISAQTEAIGPCTRSTRPTAW